MGYTPLPLTMATFDLGIKRLGSWLPLGKAGLVPRLRESLPGSG